MTEWTFRSEMASVPRARKRATDALLDLSPDALETVALVVSELVTNCVRHAGTDFRLKVTRVDGNVRIDITDGAPGTPAVRTPPPSVAHGRGLQIVQALALQWGVIQTDPSAGKTVWCVLAV